ncbi:MAG: glutathione gamma-glutamylcysteinyltransferase, partial [Gammaproteobacteria bacterium]|nr:glutathione gamma-glutamylcysteinyltransferase [Gammaproteobacteria bacterium]
MLKKLLVALLIGVCTTIACALPLPKDLIGYDSKEGQQLLVKSDHKQNFWQLSRFYVTQQNLTFCGIASSVMVLNALQVSPPFDPIYSPYKTFTQDNVFTEAVVKAVPFYKVRAMGITLNELAKLLAVFNLKTEVFYADQVSVEQFKKLAIQAVSDPKQAILVNFLRTELNQEGSGHISPLA